MVLKDIFWEQVLVARGFWSDKRTRTPILIIWVASFGGALHASVTTYFYLEIGARDVDVGILGFIMSGGSLILSPVFGYMLDARGPFEPIFLTAGACSLGCLIRGTAASIRGLQVGALFLGMGVNLWVVVLAHIANSSDRKHRSAVISGFSVQETVLRLMGKGLFPFWDMFVFSSLHVEETLPRYRVHMAVCTLFCIFGWLALLAERCNVTSTDFEESDKTTTKLLLLDEIIEETGESQKMNRATLSKTNSTEGSNCSVTYVILVFALLAQSFASTVVVVLWPLFLRDRFSFTASEFGVILFISSLSTTLSIASFPMFERRFGPSVTASLCASLAALCCFAGFVLLPSQTLDLSEKEILEEKNSLQIEEGPLMLREFKGVHLILAICLQTSLLTLEPSLKSVFSLHVPPRVQGRSIGLMATIGGLGGMGGNLIGAFLYQASKRDKNLAATLFGELSRGGRLPFLIVSALLGISAVLIGFEGYVSSSQKSEVAEGCHEDATDSVCCQSAEVTEGEDLVYDLDLLPQSQVGVGVTPVTIGSMLHLETSYDLKLD